MPGHSLEYVSSFHILLLLSSAGPKVTGVYGVWPKVLFPNEWETNKKHIHIDIYIYILYIKAFFEIGTHSGDRTVRILGKSPCKGYTGIDRISRGLGILSQ